MDLGGTNVRAAVVDFEGKIVGEGRTDSKAMEGLDATVVQIVQRDPDGRLPMPA